MRHAKTEKRQVTGDKLYNNKLVTKLINQVMQDGKKTVAEKNVYDAFDMIGKKMNENPVEVYERALQTVGPKVEVKARRVGGASYQIPQEVRGERKLALAIRWLVEAANKRSNKDFHTFAEKLSAELMDALEGKGDAIKKRDNMVRQADANKAFGHFRW
jgi:small subunit ribosomal protein S7